MALHGCDEVAVAGFGYDMSTPNAPLHYYETVRMAAIKEVRDWARQGRGRGHFQPLLWLPRAPRKVPPTPSEVGIAEVHP